MPRTLADLSLSNEFRRLRESIPPGSREMLCASQHVVLDEVRSTKQAVLVMRVLVTRILVVVPDTDLVPDHPLIRALSIVLHHPEAELGELKILSEEQRKKVLDALAKTEVPWSPGTLEWQLIQYVGAVGERVPLDERVPLVLQDFGSEPLSRAWNALLDLAVLRAWGLLT